MEEGTEGHEDNETGVERLSDLGGPLRTLAESVFTFF
jgi:hypothetical protein